MATQKKKHLIELMIEAGVKWPDGAEYATQNNNISHKVCFYKTRPQRSSSSNEWSCYGYLQSSAIKLPALCRNWHQTIVTREQYEQALTNAAVTIENNHCNSMTNQTPIRTIEQLASDYHTLAAEAYRLQSVADEAIKAADDALFALEKAGELIGLIISIDTKPKQVAQPNITDWRDLRVGDVIEHVEHNGGSAKIGSHGVVSKIYDDRIIADYPDHSGYVYSVPECQRKFRFIRRP